MRFKKREILCHRGLGEHRDKMNIFYFLTKNLYSETSVISVAGGLEKNSSFCLSIDLRFSLRTLRLCERRL